MFCLEKCGGVRAWIVDDTGFPKKGVHSAGVAWQYCGQLGKQDNCQIAVSLSVANEHASLPVAFRLYLPEDWAADPVRRARASSRSNRKSHSTKSAPPAPRACRRGWCWPMPVTGSTRRCEALTPMGLPRHGPWQGRPPMLTRRDAQNQHQSAKQLAKSLPADAWRDVACRDGVDKTLRSRFAAVR